MRGTDKYQRLLCRKFLEILDAAQDMKELKEAAAILRELRELKRPPHAQQEDGCSGGIVELG